MSALRQLLPRPALASHRGESSVGIALSRVDARSARLEREYHHLGLLAGPEPHANVNDQVADTR